MEIDSIFEGLDPAVVEAVKSSGVVDKINEFVELNKQPLISKRDELFTQNRELKNEIETLGGLESLRTLKAEKDKAEAEKRAAVEKSSDVEAIRSQFQTQLQEKDQELTKYKQVILNEKVDSTVAQAIRDAKGDVDLLAPHVLKHVKGELDNDGKAIVRVYDDNGQPLMTKDLKEATVHDLIESMKSKYAKAFEPEEKGGSGAKQTNGTSFGGVKNPWAKESKNLTEQSRLIRENPVLAQQMAAVAGVALSLEP